MPDQKEEKDEGLSWSEMIEVQTLLMSLKDKIRDKEAFVLRMVDLLNDKKIIDLPTWNHTWDDIMAIMKFVGFSKTESKDLASSIKESHNKKKN